MAKRKNIIGEVQHKLIVIDDRPSKREPSGKLVRRAYVRCDCGTEKEINYKLFHRGRIKSCGCISEAVKTKIEIGQQFTHWTVIKESEGYFDKNGEKADRTFLCKCICGKEKDVNLQSLVKEQSKSCSCQGRPKKEIIIKEKIIPQDTEEEQWKKSVTFPDHYISTLGRAFGFKAQNYITPRKNSFEIRHKQTTIIKELYKIFVGEYDESIYELYYENNEFGVENIRLIEARTERVEKLRSVYSSMKARCYNKNIPDYHRYGARGISICEEWRQSFRSFLLWALSTNYEPNIGLEIDRENNDGNYEPSNCRFIPKVDNCRNSRATKLTVDDVKRMRYGDLKDTHRKVLAEIFNMEIHSIDAVLKFKTFKEI